MAPIDRENLVCIGKVIEPYGLKGEMKVWPFTDVPEYYAGLPEVILDAGKGLRVYPVRSIRRNGRHWLFALEGVDERDGATALKGAEVLLGQARLKPLEPGQYFMDDLIGCEVVDPDQRPLGRVQAVIETGANDVLEVAGQGGVTLVPMTGEVIREVDIAARRIHIAPLPGLFGDG